MTPLRKRMLEDMQLRNFAPETQRNYLHHITGLARYYMTSPAPKPSTSLSRAAKFLYNHTLETPWPDGALTHARVPHKAPCHSQPRGSHAVIRLRADLALSRRFDDLLWRGPAPGFPRIRYYGFLASARRKQSLPLCRNLLAIPILDLLPRPALDYKDWYEAVTGESLRRCPQCASGTMRRIEILQPCGPPAVCSGAAFGPSRACFETPYRRMPIPPAPACNRHQPTPRPRLVHPNRFPRWGGIRSP